MAYLHRKRQSYAGLSHREIVMEKARASEDQQLQLQRYLKEDNRAHDAATFLDRSDAFRRRREASEVAADAEKQAELEKRELIRRHLAMTREEDARVAKILEDEETERQRETRLCEYLRQTNPELRTLQTKLYMAQVTKERRQQMKDKKLQEWDKIEKEAGFHKMMEGELAKFDKLEQEKAEKRLVDKAVVKETLDKQLEEKELQRQKELEFKEVERLRIAKVVEKEEDDDKAMANTKRSRVVRLRAFIQASLKEKAAIDRLEIDNRKEQEEEIVKYEQLVAKRLAQEKEKGQLKKELAARIYAQISAGLDDARHEKEYMTDTMNEYYFQQLEDEYYRKAEELRINKAQVKANLRAASDTYQALKKQQMQKEKVQKEVFHADMMARLAELHKLEQMTAQKQRMKKEEHRREIEKMWKMKLDIEQEQHAKDMEIQKRQQAQLVKEKERIEQERKHLLVETASRLAEFLPKGVIKTEDDLRLVGLAM